MADIQVRNNLSAPHAGKESPLYRMILSKTGMSLESAQFPIEYSTLWSGQWWGFLGSAVYRQLTDEQQQHVLKRCNQLLLNEAYFIEKSGLAYCAKMVLTAQCTDNAQLFAFIGADEAKHLAWIEPYLDASEKQIPSGHFLLFLSKLIEEFPPGLLVYLVQIILEGWGLDHYTRLSKSCAQPQLSKIFSSILKDEALHHHSGNLLFDSTMFSVADFSLISDALQGYTQMVRVGPQAAVAAIDQIAGGLSLQEIEEVFVALRHEEETQRKLTLLKQLMLQPGVEGLVETLAAAGNFAPMSSHEAACSYLSAR
jgi:rubrerythrin